MLPGCEEAGAAAQAERLRAGFDSREFRCAGKALRVTCSLGISWTEMADVAQTEALIRCADEALYLAKHRGRNRLELVSLHQESLA